MSWTSCSRRASIHSEGSVRGLLVSRTLKLQKVLSFADKTLLSGAMPWHLRHSGVPLTLCYSLRRICRWFNNILMCKARPHPPFFWDLCMVTVSERLQSWLCCLSAGLHPENQALLFAPAPGSTLPCSRYQSSSRNRAMLCALTPSRAESKVWVTQLPKRAKRQEISQHSLSAGCP